MRNTTQVERKPSPAQVQWINEAINTDGTYRINLPARSRQIMLDAGWLVERPTTGDAFYTHLDYVTDAARMAVGRSDTIRIPDVKAGDVLVYRTHPGHSFRVTEVLTNKYGQAFRGITLTVDAESGESGARVGRNEHTAEFDVQAYQVRPESAAEMTARVEREMDEAALNQASPAYQHFARTVRAARSYVAAIDALYGEALAEHAARLATAAEAVTVLREGPAGLAAWTADAQRENEAGMRGFLTAAAARTGTTGARRLCAPDIRLSAAEAAEIDHGAVLHGVAVATAHNDTWGGCRRGGLPDATVGHVWVHVPEVGNRDFRPIGQGRDLAQWRLRNGAAF